MQVQGQQTQRPSRQQGSGTVLALGLSLLLLLVAISLIGLIGVGLASHRAATAADLAALAAADAARGLHPADPCSRAAQLAQAHGASLLACSQPPGRYGTVDVRTSYPIPGPFSWLGSAQGLARAGPAPDSGRNPDSNPDSTPDVHPAR